MENRDGVKRVGEKFYLLVFMIFHKYRNQCFAYEEVANAPISFITKKMRVKKFTN